MDEIGAASWVPGQRGSADSCDRVLLAVELKRAALEQRERALETREAEIDEREARIAESESRPPDAESDDQLKGPLLLFVPGAVSYSLVEAERGSVSTGGPLDLDGKEYTVTRVGASPLPGDSRRCAYLVHRARRLSDMSP